MKNCYVRYEKLIKKNFKYLKFAILLPLSLRVNM